MTHRHTAHGRRWRRGALALTVILTVAGCSGPNNTGIPPLAQKHFWETSFNRGDSAAVVALYAPDAELVTSGAAPVRGPAAIRAEIDTMIKSGVKVRIETDRAEQAGDLAYFYGSYSVSSKQGVVERGTYLEVWRRSEGNWLIELDVNSTGAPIGQAPQH